MSFTAATNGSATLAPGGDRLIAEIQNVLWSIPRTGGKAVPLTPAGLEPNRPVYAPDGKLVAFCAYRGGGFHVWTMRPDGSDVRQRTDGPWDDRGPAWSPDGTRIAFASERGGDPVTGSPYRIHVLDLRTGEVARVTGRPGQEGPLQDGAWEDFDPTWSPDGKRVLFVRAKGVTTANGLGLDARTVAAVRTEGAGPVVVEHTETTAAQIMTPALAPDGRRLAHLRTTAAPNASCTLVVERRTRRGRRGHRPRAAPLDAGGRVAAHRGRSPHARTTGEARGDGHDPLRGRAARGPAASQGQGVRPRAGGTGPSGAGHPSARTLARRAADRLRGAQLAVAGGQFG